MTERNAHPGFTIESAGFFISLTHGYIGASPDGIFKCPCCPKMVIELKCPYSHRNETLFEAALNDSQFCLTAGEDGKLDLKKSHSYYAQVRSLYQLKAQETHFNFYYTQVQIEMFACEAKKCFFCVFTLKDFACIEVDFDEKFVF